MSQQSKRNTKHWWRHRTVSHGSRGSCDGTNICRRGSHSASPLHFERFTSRIDTNNPSRTQSANCACSTPTWSPYRSSPMHRYLTVSVWRLHDESPMYRPSCKDVVERFDETTNVLMLLPTRNRSIAGFDPYISWEGKPNNIRLKKHARIVSRELCEKLMWRIQKTEMQVTKANVCTRRIKQLFGRIAPVYHAWGTWCTREICAKNSDKGMQVEKSNI